MQIESKNHRLGYYEFYTWGEFLDYCKENSGKGCGTSADSGSHALKFSGTRTFDEAMDIARNGWLEGEANIASMSAGILNKVTGLIEKDKIVYDVEGLGIDVAAYVNGEPECWQRFDTEIGEGEGTKHVRLVFNSTVSAGISKKVIEARGAATAALVQALEYAGTRVELWVVAIAVGTWGTAALECRVLVKAADQDLDMSRVAFALAHPSMLRRMGFAIQESNQAATDEFGFGYGTPTGVLDKGDIYIDEGMLGEAQWDRPESAIKWVLGRLQKQGVNLAA